MDWFLQQIFLLEVKLQCEFILLARKQLEEIEAQRKVLRERSKKRPENADDLRALGEELQESISHQWMALQTISVSAANLSKLFWGNGGKKDAERKPLRDCLAVGDGSCLQSPDLRNDFEHFDERIQLRFSETEKKGFIGRNIGPIGENFVKVGDEEPNTRFGHYDPSTGVLSFWANSANVFDIVAEAQRILPLAEAEILKGSWGE